MKVFEQQRNEATKFFGKRFASLLCSFVVKAK